MLMLVTHMGFYPLILPGHRFRVQIQGDVESNFGIASGVLYETHAVTPGRLGKHRAPSRLEKPGTMLE